MPDIRQLREQRAKAVQDARTLVDAAEAEKRELSGEETARYDGFIGDAEKLGAKIAQEERLRDLERATALREAGEEGEERARRQPGAADAERAFQTWLRTGVRSALLAGRESRDLQADDGPSGGFITAPQMFVSQLIKAVDDAVMVRQLATTWQLGTAGSLGAPELAADPADADWTTELGTGNADTAMGFRKRELYTHPLAKRIKISKDLMRKSVMPMEALVRDRFGYKFGVTQEKAFLTGSGDRQPLGVMVASSAGIPTSRDISTGNTTTAIGADNLIEVKYSLKGQHQAAAVWMFHRTAIKQLAKLKDGEGQYLWGAGLRSDAPDTLLGRPVYMSEYMPSTFTTGLYVGIFGDFTHYWIADALDMQMQRLDELYAETNQVGFIARMETDGAPVLAEAFARVKLA